MSGPQRVDTPGVLQGLGPRVVSCERPGARENWSGEHPVEGCNARSEGRARSPSAGGSAENPRAGAAGAAGRSCGDGDGYLSAGERHTGGAADPLCPTAGGRITNVKTFAAHRPVTPACKLVLLLHSFPSHAHSKAAQGCVPARMPVTATPASNP